MLTEKDQVEKQRIELERSLAQSAALADELRSEVKRAKAKADQDAFVATQRLDALAKKHDTLRHELDEHIDKLATALTHNEKLKSKLKAKMSDLSERDQTVAALETTGATQRALIG